MIGWNSNRKQWLNRARDVMSDVIALRTILCKIEPNPVNNKIIINGIFISNCFDLNSVAFGLHIQANSNRNVTLAFSHRQCFNEIKQFKRFVELGIKTLFAFIKNPRALYRVHRNVTSNESTPVRRKNRRLLRARDVWQNSPAEARSHITAVGDVSR